MRVDTLLAKLYSNSVQLRPGGKITTITYSHAREHLAELWNELEETREMALIRRRGHEDMALIPADELASLRETAYLLRSPANAERLLSALNEARRGKKGRPFTIDSLRKELGLEEKR